MMGFVKSIESKKDKTSVYLIFISVLLGIVYQTFQTLMSNNSGFMLIILSNLIGYWGCSSFIYRHKLPQLSRQFILIVIYMFLVGLSYKSIFNKAFLTTALIQDFRYVMYFMSGCVFAYSDDTMDSFHSIMKVLSIISVVLGIYALVFYDFSYANIETRGGTWSLSYMMWWTAASCWIYWSFYGLIMKKNLLYSIGPAVFYIVLGMLFLKREVFAYIAIIVFIYIFFGRQSMGGLVKTIFFLIALVLVIYAIAPGMFSGVLGLILNRFDDVESLEEFDRNIESNNYLNEASYVQIIFGNGIGHYHVFKNVYLASSRGILNATHLGYVNLLYKGGVVLVLYYLILLKNVLSRLFNKTISPYMQVCVGASMTYFISLFFGGSWTYTIAPFCISAPLFYAVTKSGKR